MRRHLFNARQALRATATLLREELFETPIEPILHASKVRIRLVGLFMLVGYPLFYAAWTYWSPQPYENLSMRIAGALLGASLLLPAFSADPSSRRAGIWFNVVCFVNLPLYFSFMFIANDGNPVWLASLAAMILIYFHLTDWRIANIGLVAGAALAWLGVVTLAPYLIDDLAHDLRASASIFFFAWSASTFLGLSGANLRRERLRQMLSTIGILAHELRTPLATISLISQALEARLERLSRSGGIPLADYVETRAHTSKMSDLVKLMNQQINTQIANAGLLHPSLSKEDVRMSDVVSKVLADYPFASAEERDCVTVQIRADFSFTGSFNLACQLLVNLLKNALRALAAKPESLQTGDIVIQLHRHVVKGRTVGQLIVEDHGIGMPPEVLKRIFDPFFTTNTRSGHGLGLTFCIRATEAMHGRILCHSQV
ncbi:MAG: HAMP domain-containing histidine kinase, partial [Betaproteobacteria bacterium]|nr:HAMP domain-containing histidine kinase [Betaproteobacteria bacterium]